MTLTAVMTAEVSTDAPVYVRPAPMLSGVPPGKKMRIVSPPSVAAQTPKANSTCCSASRRVDGIRMPVSDSSPMPDDGSYTTSNCPSTMSEMSCRAEYPLYTPPEKLLRSKTPIASSQFRLYMRFAVRLLSDR